MRWDIFCRVIDNFGDVGVCWRLATDLAARGETVRLWLDDTTALAWMAPRGAANVEVVSWAAPAPDLDPGDVVIEAFGCEPPVGFVARMSAQVWVNLEYLSAEAYVERSHGLASPRRDGRVKWFFYPGFTERTGGLIREPRLLTLREAFDGDAWLQRIGVARRPGERLVSLFCYPEAPARSLLQSLADRPTLLLAAPSAAAPPTALPPNIRWRALPFLTQPDFDRLLWCCDLNIVRGEDSFVRAHWAGAPFLWQLYPQQDGAHAAKLEAFLDHLDAGPEVTQLFRAWNGLAPWPDRLPPTEKWAEDCLRWRGQLLAQNDLTTQLIRFVGQKG